MSAKDKAGNASAYSAGAGFTLALVQENNSAVSYSPGWTRQLLSGSSGGSVDFTSKAAATATLSFKGKQSRLGVDPRHHPGRSLGECRWRLTVHGYHSRRL